MVKKCVSSKSHYSPIILKNSSEIKCSNKISLSQLHLENYFLFFNYFFKIIFYTVDAKSQVTNRIKIINLNNLI